MPRIDSVASSEPDDDLGQLEMTETENDFERIDSIFGSPGCKRTGPGGRNLP